MARALATLLPAFEYRLTYFGRLSSCHKLPFYQQAVSHLQVIVITRDELTMLCWSGVELSHAPRRSLGSVTGFGGSACLLEAAGGRPLELFTINRF